MQNDLHPYVAENIATIASQSRLLPFYDGDEEESYQEESGNAHDLASQAIVVGCGDYRLLPFVRKYLKRMKKIEWTDVASTAGGSRTLSHYLVGEDELEEFEIKRRALLYDLNKYKHHRAGICVIACHSRCGYWPKFENEEEEFEAHRISLVRARAFLQERLPEIKEFILLYIELEKQAPYMPVRVYEIQPDGICAVVDTRTEPLLAVC